MFLLMIRSKVDYFTHSLTCQRQMAMRVKKQALQVLFHFKSIWKKKFINLEVHSLVLEVYRYMPLSQPLFSTFSGVYHRCLYYHISIRFWLAKTSFQSCLLYFAVILRIIVATVFLKSLCYFELPASVCHRHVLKC